MVGVTGFEPATPRSRTVCSTRLSHTPTRCTWGMNDSHLIAFAGLAGQALIRFFQVLILFQSLRVWGEAWFLVLRFWFCPF